MHAAAEQRQRAGLIFDVKRAVELLVSVRTGAKQFESVALVACDVGVKVVAREKLRIEHYLHGTIGAVAIVESEIHFALGNQAVVEIEFARLDDFAHVLPFAVVEKIIVVVFPMILVVDVCTVL